MTTSTAVDAVLLVVLMGLGALVVLTMWLSQQLLPVRPLLPVPDQPPAGLGRLVPVGRQVDAEVRQGLHALDLWLRSTRVRP